MQSAENFVIGASHANWRFCPDCRELVNVKEIKLEKENL